MPVTTLLKLYLYSFDMRLGSVLGDDTDISYIWLSYISWLTIAVWIFCSPIYWTQYLCSAQLLIFPLSQICPWIANLDSQRNKTSYRTEEHVKRYNRQRAHLHKLFLAFGMKMWREPQNVSILFTTWIREWLSIPVDTGYATSYFNTPFMTHLRNFNESNSKNVSTSTNCVLNDQRHTKWMWGVDYPVLCYIDFSVLCARDPTNQSNFSWLTNPQGKLSNLNIGQFSNKARCLYLRWLPFRQLETTEEIDGLTAIVSHLFLSHG